MAFEFISQQKIPVVSGKKLFNNQKKFSVKKRKKNPVVFHLCNEAGRNYYMTRGRQNCKILPTNSY